MSIIEMIQQINDNKQILTNFADPKQKYTRLWNKNWEIEKGIKQLRIIINEFLIIKTFNELKFRYESWIMFLFQKTRKENKLSILKQLFNHLKQKERWMNLFDVVTAINRI